MNLPLKTILPLAFLAIFACKSVPQPSTTLHPAVQLAKERSYYTDQVDWREVNDRFGQLAAGRQSGEAFTAALQFLINSLGDKHAQVRSLSDYSLVVSYTGEVAEATGLPRNSTFMQTVINDVSARFSYELLENNVGYLRVVGIGPGEVQEQANFIRDGLKDLKAKGVDKWIVDLRYNGGGNMEPMICGLAPLFGEGKIGAAVNQLGEVTRVHRIENGQFNHNGRMACQMDSLPAVAPTEKVAVLLSRYTISSGEMVAVAFKGRGHTRFIGEETAGYTTGNGFTHLNDELALVISEDVFADRNDQPYLNGVDVDDHLPFQHNLTLADDPQLAAAMKWLAGG